MHPILSTGLLIGLLCGAWMFTMGFTGWYLDPAKLNLFFLVVIIEVAGLVLGLRMTAAQGRTYSGQVVAGTGMAIVAGVVIFICSMLFTTVAFPDYFADINAYLKEVTGEDFTAKAFPDYFADIKEMSRRIMAGEGKSEAEIQAIIAAAAPRQTPVANALSGFVGTFVTGVVASAVIGLWVKAHPPAAR